ncbi:hypothetical protein Trydic_g15337 [Trypoxylus dichotomus]
MKYTESSWTINCDSYSKTVTGKGTHINQAHGIFVYYGYFSGYQLIVQSITRTLTMILDTKYNLTSSYRLQLVSEVYNSGSVGKNAAFGYIVNNWSQITNLFGETQLPSLLDKISFGLTTEEQLIRLTAVIPKNMSEILQRALEAVTMNIRWVNQQLPSILNWLNKRF